jgi:hypothetical protein
VLLPETIDVAMIDLRVRKHRKQACPSHRRGWLVSLRVSFVVFFAIAIVLFVFFVVWIFLNEDIGSNPAIRRV